MELPPPISEPPALPKPAAMSLPARLMNIFAVPGDVLDEVKTAPTSTGNWLGPAFLLIIVSWLGTALVMSQDSLKHQWTEFNERIIQKQIEKMNLPKEQMEKVRPAMEKWTGIMSTAGFFAQAVFVGFITPFGWGLVLWLVGAKGFKGGFSYMKAAEVAGLANVITSLEAVVRTLLIFLAGNIFAAPSLLIFVKDFDPQNPVHLMMGAVNVFQFWFLAVAAMGLARLSNRSFAKAAVWIYGIWAAYSALFIGYQAAMQAVFSHAKGGGA
jgi:hypothetical protein